MNLIIDAGNSFVKLAVFEADTLVRKKTVDLKDFSEKNIEDIVFDINIDNVILSSVANLADALVKKIAAMAKVLVLDQNTPVPFKNLYATPKTLGIDRIALVSAAVQQYKHKNVLVLDAGTCITYDFVTGHAEYMGGAISPGLTMRYRALHDYTAKLPLLEKTVPAKITGDSTESSIHSGVVCGILNEIEGIVEKYQKKYPDLTIILTGGDANFLSKQLKSSIFANSNFLLEGLNSILQFNSHE